MKIKDLKINKEFFILGTVFTLALGGTFAYFQYERPSQVCEYNMDNKTFTNENGDVCCYFEPGEHIIKISRNDAYYRKIESVEGYEIEKLVINNWRFNNQVTYVNKEPVLATGTLKNNGTVEFNSFGKVTEQSQTKTLK